MDDRAIEIGAVCIENGVVVDHFQELMCPHKRISRFIGGYNLVAHNASFDKCFLDAELNRIGRSYTGKLACSMLVARRVYQDAPNHKLGGLIKYTNIPSDGTFHRALYDSEMTAKLWLNMLDMIKKDYGVAGIKFDLLAKLAKIKKSNVHGFM